MTRTKQSRLISAMRKELGTDNGGLAKLAQVRPERMIEWACGHRTLPPGPCLRLALLSWAAGRNDIAEPLVRHFSALTAIDLDELRRMLGDILPAQDGGQLVIEIAEA